MAIKIFRFCETCGKKTWFSKGSCLNCGKRKAP